MDLLRDLWPDLPEFPSEISQQVQNDATYVNYIRRQELDVSALKRDENLRIPVDFEFNGLAGLSHELQKKLSTVRPETLGQASRIDGMTPAALTLLLGRIKQFTGQKSA
jgi:tRNA uridine 5-carboxymethylaminomethyl modification enzyme